MDATKNVDSARRARRREVTVAAVGESSSTEVRYGSLRWSLSADDADSPDPVSSFLGALGSCLLMSIRAAARARNLTVGKLELIARANEKGHVKEIEVELQVQTDLDDDKLHRLIEVAERGCHIRAIIRDDVAFALKIKRI
jgi:pyruvate dehydrogenase E2 component (dihydrolipoamide acetyltransferase)